jgi:hypothetical protein
MKRVVTEPALPETLVLPRIDTLEQAAGFVHGTAVPDVADLDAMAVYADGYYKVRRPGEDGVSFARTTMLGVRESLSAQEFARLSAAADPEHWLLTTEVREALLFVLAASDLSQIPDPELLEMQPKNPDDAAAMLAGLQANANKRLDLDRQIRLRKEQPDRQHAARAGTLGVASLLDQQATDGDNAPEAGTEQEPAYLM